MGPVELEALFLGEPFVAAVLALSLDISDLLNGFLNRLEIGEKTTQPPVVDIELTATLRFLFDCFLRLPLRSHEEYFHVGLRRDRLGNIGESVSEEFLGLLEVNDVYAVSLTEDIFLHLRVPSSDLVSEVNSCLEKFLHGYCSHC